MQFRPESARSPLQRRVTWSDFVTKAHAVSSKVTGDLEPFHGKSACGPVKILRGARDDIVCTCICVILIGVAVWLHARGARIWGSLGSCPKRVVFRHEGPVFYGVVPERGLFRAQV